MMNTPSGDPEEGGKASIYLSGVHQGYFDG